MIEANINLTKLQNYCKQTFQKECINITIEHNASAIDRDSIVVHILLSSVNTVNRYYHASNKEDIDTMKDMGIELK